MNPRVSVVIPTHNRGKTLARAIRSVLNQTFQDFELIVVDDASRDNTRTVVEGFTDARVRYIRHETNLGACAARNTGIGAALGALIAFQDSDDEWLADKLQTQVELLDRRGEQYGACYTNFIRVQDNQPARANWGGVSILEGDILPSLLHISFVSTQTLMVRAELVRQVGKFDSAMPRHQDWDLVLRLARITKFAFVPEPMVLIYATPGNISSNVESDIVGRLRIVEKMSSFSEVDPRLLRAGMARHTYLSGRAAMRLPTGPHPKYLLWKAVKLRPFFWRNWVALAAALFLRRRG